MREGAVASSTVFTSDRRQAVRLPKAVAFPDDVHQVDILKIGQPGDRAAGGFRAPAPQSPTN